MNLFFTDSKRPVLSIALVIVQFACIFYILLSDTFYPTNWMVIIYLSGISLGFWAIYAMREGKINIPPDVVPGTQLITRGPYRFIRHPMYLAIFLTLLPLVIQYFNIPRLMVYILLIVNQVIKLNYEEQKLIKVFDGYYPYKKVSWRLIPLIY